MKCFSLPQQEKGLTWLRSFLFFFLFKTFHDKEYATYYIKTIKRTLSRSQKAGVCCCIECTPHSPGGCVHLRAIVHLYIYYNSNLTNSQEMFWEGASPSPSNLQKRYHLGKQWSWCWLSIYKVYFWSFRCRHLAELKWLIWIYCILLCLNLGPFSQLLGHSKTNKKRKKENGYLLSSEPELFLLSLCFMPDAVLTSWYMLAHWVLYCYSFFLSLSLFFLGQHCMAWEILVPWTDITHAHCRGRMDS